MKYKKRNHRLYILSALIGVFACYAINILTPATFQRGFSYCAYPILIMQNSLIAPINSFFKEKRTVLDLHHKLKQLQQEKDAIVADNIALQATLSYAQDIKEIIDFKRHYTYENLHLAHIIAKNISDQTHFYLIDAGSNAGIKKNMIAVYNNGIIGKVEEVYPLYSKVMLITDRSCKIAACCAKTHAQGIYEGCNSQSSALLNRVSHLSTLQENDLVVSTGQGLIFPQGFGLGIVRKYQRDSVTYRIELEPLFVVPKGDIAV